MITEQQLKADCTPDIIKKMIELAEGFKHPILIPDENDTWERQISLIYDTYLFPLLIYRAVEGWNKLNKDRAVLTLRGELQKTLDWRLNGVLEFKNYQPSSLTPCECACLHCLIEVLK